MKDCKNQRKGHGEDRISELPDPIINNIFRFLTTKDVVCSSVLSKRWRGLWTAAQCLTFNDYEFSSTEDFTRFTDAVLLLRDPIEVHEFRLRWWDDYDESIADVWIRYANNHKVRVLHLRIDSPSRDYDLLPSCIFTSRYLEELHVSFYRHPEIYDFSFSRSSRIRKLTLENVYIDQDCLEELIQGCLAIEELHLYDCLTLCGRDNNLFLCSDTLKSLRIEDFHTAFREVIICMPSLVDLHYNASNLRRLSLENLPSLVHACISDSNCDYDAGESEPEPIGSVMRIITGLSKARSLKLYGQWIELVTKDDLEEFPMFPNLRSLVVGKWQMSDNFRAVSNFLQHSPYLEKLILEECRRPRSLNRCEGIIWKSAELSFGCPRLEMIEIQCSKRNDKVQKLVKILLANSEDVHKIMINPS